MLHTILQTVGFFSFILGMAGIGGAIELNQGWTASIVLILLGIAFMAIGFKEEGGFKNNERRR